MLGEPLRDTRHVLLEVARRRDIEDPGTFRAAVLEVMGHVARHHDERPGARLDPFGADQHAHRAGQDIEHVVLRMRMRAGPLGVRVEPPLRDRIQLPGLRTVGLEDRRVSSGRGGGQLVGVIAAGVAERGEEVCDATGCGLRLQLPNRRFRSTIKVFRGAVSAL